MKSSLFSKIMMLTLTLALATSAFAATKGSFRISDTTQVNGKQLPAGDYVARWEGTGPNVQVDILSEGKVLMTVPAQIVNLDQKSPENASEVRSTAGGRELNVLRFSGKKYSLNLSGQSAQADMGAGDSAK